MLNELSPILRIIYKKKSDAHIILLGAFIFSKIKWEYTDELAGF